MLTRSGSSAPLILAALLVAPAARADYIREEEAIEAVRQFESDPALALQVMDLDETLPTLPCYILRAQNEAIYRVDAITGRVASASHCERMTLGLSEEAVRAAAMPIEQARDIALSFARAHYPEFDALGLSLQDERYHFRCYHFAWGQVLPSNGAHTQNFCHVEVAADTGLIVGYGNVSETIPPEANRQPSISAQDALNIAMAAVGAAQAEDVEQELVYHRGPLYWLTKMTAVAPNGERQHYVVEVDADSAQVLLTGQALSGSLFSPPTDRLMVAHLVIRKAHGPLFEGDQAFVSEDLLRALGAKVERDKRGYVVKAGDKEQRAETTAMQDGKLFLPAMMLRDLLPEVESVQVDPKAGTVNVVISRRGGGDPKAPGPYASARQRLRDAALVDTRLRGLKRQGTTARIRQAVYLGRTTGPRTLRIALRYGPPMAAVLLGVAAAFVLARGLGVQRRRSRGRGAAAVALPRE